MPGGDHPRVEDGLLPGSGRDDPEVGVNSPLFNYVWVTSRTILYVKYLYLTL